MATITITTTSQQDQRIIAAVGKYLGLPGNANLAQVKAFTFGLLKQAVMDQEKIDAETAAIAAADAGLTDLGSAT